MYADPNENLEAFGGIFKIQQAASIPDAIVKYK